MTENAPEECPECEALWRKCPGCTMLFVAIPDTSGAERCWRCHKNEATAAEQNRLVARIAALEAALAASAAAWGEVIGNDNSNRPGGCPDAEFRGHAVRLAHLHHDPEVLRPVPGKTA